MNTQSKTMRARLGRRRFLGLLAGLATLGPVLPLRPKPHLPEALSLKEADFYRSQDLAG